MFLFPYTFLSLTLSLTPLSLSQSVSHIITSLFLPVSHCYLSQFYPLSHCLSLLLSLSHCLSSPKVDGCVTFYKRSKFTLVESYAIEFNDSAREAAAAQGEWAVWHSDSESALLLKALSNSHTLIALMTKYLLTSCSGTSSVSYRCIYLCQCERFQFFGFVSLPFDVSYHIDPNSYLSMYRFGW